MHKFDILLQKLRSVFDKKLRKFKFEKFAGIITGKGWVDNNS